MRDKTVKELKDNISYTTEFLLSKSEDELKEILIKDAGFDKANEEFDRITSKINEYQNIIKENQDVYEKIKKTIWYHNVRHGDLIESFIKDENLFNQAKNNPELFSKILEAHYYTQIEEGQDINKALESIISQTNKAKDKLIRETLSKRNDLKNILNETENEIITIKENISKSEDIIKSKTTELNQSARESGLVKDGDNTQYVSAEQIFGSFKGRAITIGNNSFSSGDEAIVLGYGTTNIGERSNSVGSHNQITTANNNVIGNDNVITKSTGNAFLGNNITFNNGESTNDNVALGNNSVISNPSPTPNIEIKWKTYNFAGVNPTSVVTVGSEGKERQIQYVAAGRISNTSTDAVNGSQLHAVIEALNKFQGGLDINDPANPIVDKVVQSFKAGDKISIETSQDSYGDNIYTISANTSEVKGGENVIVTESKNEKGGSVYTVSVQGDLNNIDSISNEDGTKITLGNKQVNVEGNRITNVGTPIDPKDATNKEYVDSGRTTVSSKDDTVQVIKSVNETTGATNYDLSITKGNSFQTDDGKVLDKKLGETTSIVGDNNTYTTITDDGKVQVGLNKQITVEEIKVGGDKNGKGTVIINNNGVNAGGNKITNVKDGEISSTSQDAVNGSQLHATNVQVNQNTQNIAQMGSRFQQLDNKIDQVDKRARRGTAIAGAIGMLPQPHQSGKSMMSAATTNYRGEQALAVGYSRISDNGKHLIKLSGSSNMSGKKDVMVGAAYGYQW